MQRKDSIPPSKYTILNPQQSPHTYSVFPPLCGETNKHIYWMKKWKQNLPQSQMCF